jgi:HAD superfamily hydrolase (TIGR01549 family)
VAHASDRRPRYRRKSAGLRPDLRALVSNVELLCLDAGNTIVFLDHRRLADLFREAVSFCDQVTSEALVVVEGEAKRLAESGGLHDCAWTFRERPGAATWGKMVGTMALRAGIAEELVPKALDHVWKSHEALNLWSKLPEGIGPALDAVRSRGIKVAIISNSEGMLERLLRTLGAADHFDLIVDSGIAGVEKPDPRIFQIAFDRFGVAPSAALHLGDVFATDVLGARAAGCRHALIDPFGHYEGLHLDVPRVSGVVEVARAIEATV